MGIQERKQRERERRRIAIIDGASKIFIKKGLMAATMEEIAQMAELSKATLYLYFKNKEELFLAVLLIVLEKFNETMSYQPDANANPIDKVRTLGTNYLSFYQKHPAYYKILNTMEPADDFAYDQYELSKDLGLANAKIWETVCAPIIEGVQKGIFRSDIVALEVGMTLWMGSAAIINLMGHVQCSPHHNHEYKELPQDAALNHVKSLDYLRMLRDFWEATLQYIIVK